MAIDILVILVYFVFLIVIGWAFRSFSQNTSDYFKGGGKMLWWMVGATAFMVQFSALVFTGIAGKALTDGLSVMMVFFGNAFGYFCNYLFFAAKSRQMRVVTPMEGMRLRYGKVNEQVFIWCNVPNSVLSAAIWLNSLAIFAATVFDVPVPITIIVTGAVVVLMSVTGGAWAVVASDFLQMVVVMAVSVTSAIVAAAKSGGVVPLLEKGLPENAFAGPGYIHMGLFVFWAFTAFAKQLFSTNNMMDSYRFMCAKDTKHARKGALLACCLMFIGPLIWFLPDFFVAGNYPDTSTWGLESLGNSIKDATYYMFVSREMPAGMVGLMMGAIFAATMSSMDSALNRNAGIYVRNFHKHFINKDADEEKMLQIGKKATVVFGVAVIVVGLFLNQVQDMGLFNMMMMVNALISFPMWIPGLLGFFVKKTPDWGAWATVVVGGCVSAFVAFIVTPEMIENVLHLSSPLTKHEFSDIKSLALPILLHLCITLPFFLLTQLFYKGHTPERQAEVDLFFNNTCTEVVSKAGVDDELDNRQRSMLGKLIFTLGACTLLLQLVPNSFADHMVFLLVSGIILVIGGLLVLSARKSSKN